MGNKWSRVRPKPKTARILLAALFAFPIPVTRQGRYFVRCNDEWRRGMLAADARR
jgi:hypothetical protein